MEDRQQPEAQPVVISSLVPADDTLANYGAVWHENDFTAFIQHVPEPVDGRVNNCMLFRRSIMRISLARICITS